jgi:hypothetical protein
MLLLYPIIKEKTVMSGYHLGKLVAPFTWIGIAKHTKVGMIWVAGRSPTLVSQNLKATTLTYLAINGKVK